MRPLIHEIQTANTPESLVEQLHGEPGVVALRSRLFDSQHARYSFVAARPFLTFRSFGSRCEIEIVGDERCKRSAEFIPLPQLGPEVKRTEGRAPTGYTQFGDPWHILDGLMARYELLDEVDLPFPLGGCFGYWGYDLKNFVEPKLFRRAVNDLELPDCHVGFYDSLVVFDHRLGKTWIVSTGLDVDGSRSELRAQERVAFWQTMLGTEPKQALTLALSLSKREREKNLSGGTVPTVSEQPQASAQLLPLLGVRTSQSSDSVFTVESQGAGDVFSNLSRPDFIAAVERARRYIHAGDIYQVNLSQRLAVTSALSGWEMFQRLSSVSPAPFAAYLDCGEFQITSSSPELFLRLSGPHILTRPIKGTRPRSADPTRDAQLTYELQTSPKEMAELVMITDLLRNDLGRVCEYGSVQVPELVRLERYPQVQHLVSTVEGRLRPDVTHFAAFASCFPGGSITGAPKFRAMDIIDELEPLTRGPYTGALGYLGFNRESQLSIVIRTALRRNQQIFFNVGAGIVAESNPEAEYEETIAKASGFLAALNLQPQREYFTPAASVD